MKLTPLLSLLAGSILVAAGIGPGPRLVEAHQLGDLDWLDDLEEAERLARESDRAMLVVFR